MGKGLLQDGAAVDENAAYRAKAGVAVDESGLAKYRSDREQEIARLHAENKVLLKENDALEEERVRMKRQILQLAPQSVQAQNGWSMRLSVPRHMSGSGRAGHL